MKKILIACFIAGLCGNAFAKGIEVRKVSDYHVIEQFFKSAFEYSEYGYVLDGTKPISGMKFSPLADLIAPQTLRFREKIVAKEFVRVWRALCPEQKDFVLKISECQSNPLPRYEFSLINMSKLQEVIEDNLDLFRYVLGPTLNAEELTHYIAHSKEPVSDILHEDNALIGIVYGFGTYNSLMHSRLESIQDNNEYRTEDHPPYQPKSEHADIGNDIQLKMMYLAKANDQDRGALKHSQHLVPSISFNTLQHELETIATKSTGIEKLLWAGKRPYMIFGSYEMENVSKETERIFSAQKRVREMQQRPDFIEYVLEKITGERPEILCDLTPGAVPQLELPSDIEAYVAETVLQMCQQLDKETQPAFIEAFCAHDATKISRGMAHAMPGALEGLNNARVNLASADMWMRKLSRSRKTKEIVPQKLYFECKKMGSGLAVDKHHKLLMSYLVESPDHTVYTSSYHKWSDVEQMIPGLVHGIQGMREGESRTIYMHPSIAYGALTSLPPCQPLIVTITLHQIDTASTRDLEPILPIDLAWVSDGEFYHRIEETHFKFARSMGSRWGTYLFEHSELDFAKIQAHVTHLMASTNKESVVLEKEQQREQYCNSAFWNVVCGAKKAG